MIHCLHCGAETSNGLALCELCRRYAEDCLASLPVYFRNLSRQRRPGRPNGSLGGGGGYSDEDSTPSPAPALGRAANDIDTWSRLLADDRGIDLPDGTTEAETFTALCALLAERITSVATLEWAGQFVRDLTRHDRALRALTDTLVPGWYAGGCKRCGAANYVVPGLAWVTCGGCGVSTFARDHLETVLDEAREWVARPKPIAEAVVALIDTEQSVERLHKRISKWGETRTVKRKVKLEDGRTEVVKVTIPPRITSQRRRDGEGDEVGPKRYRLGDVLDLLLSTGPTRVGDNGAAVEASAS